MGAHTVLRRLLDVERHRLTLGRHREGHVEALSTSALDPLGVGVEVPHVPQTQEPQQVLGTFGIGGSHRGRRRGDVFPDRLVTRHQPTGNGLGATDADGVSQRRTGILTGELDVHGDHCLVDSPTQDGLGLAVGGTEDEAQAIGQDQGLLRTLGDADDGHALEPALRCQRGTGRECATINQDDDVRQRRLPRGRGKGTPRTEILGQLARELVQGVRHEP